MNCEVAIVTGGASGIGRAIAEKFIAVGAKVAIIDHDADAAAATGAALGAACGESRVRSYCLDVCDQESVVRAVAQIADELGEPGILAHSAGIGLERDFLKTTLQEWRRIIDVNLTGTFLCCQAVAERMVLAQTPGRLIVLASTAGLRGGFGRAAYGATKGGVIALTRVMAVELAPYGVTANAIAPGAIETDLVQRMHSAETRRVYRRSTPLDRYGRPEEVAAAALFLASAEAAYITGAVLCVDGGFTAAGLMRRD